MDTNDLTEKAYKILHISESINHIITVELGCLCGNFVDENSYLNEVMEFISYIKEDPEEYIDDWDLWDEITPKKLLESVLRLENYVKTVIDTPIKKRGLTIEKKIYG